MGDRLLAIPPLEPAGGGEARGVRTSPRRLRQDRTARWMVTAGGLLIILAILGILLFILLEILPLTRPADVRPRAAMEAPTLAAPQAVVTDEYRTHLAALGLDGVVRVHRMADGAVVSEHPLMAAGNEDGLHRVEAIPGTQAFAASTQAGHVLHIRLSWDVSFDQQNRRIVELDQPEVVSFDLGPGVTTPEVFAVRVGQGGSGLAVVQMGEGDILLAQRQTEENAITGEVEVTFETHRMASPVRMTRLFLDGERENLYGTSAGGSLVWWPLKEGRPGEMVSTQVGKQDITAMSPLQGERALVLGSAAGELSVWFSLRREGGHRFLRDVRTFPSLPGAVRLIVPSFRTRTFMAQDALGNLGLYYSTSERVLWMGRSPLPAARAAFLTPKDDGALLVSDGRIAAVDIDSPHPEASLKAYFAKVWYEDHPEPTWTWQTSGPAEFEPKLSLVNLLWGTLKGTFYALLVAVPVAVLSAMFCSQFMHPTYSRFVKPTVEIMASLPSVVLGLIAGLWLAPKLGAVLPGVFLMFLLVPVFVVLAGSLWRRVPPRFRGRLRPGAEVVPLGLAVMLGATAGLLLGKPLEGALFGGSFPQWLVTSAGVSFDQRNALVIGIAMGFAVVPIIFTISEEAFSNVPRTMASASFALGANRWQTVVKVILPMASPGIFSAVMVGFGRAVGETMIVVMATGSTPIMTFNPFDGFRTLSASIAIEMPDAPEGGTLYRTLFLAAGLLFALTFVVNTFSDLVRQRLRRRFEAL